MTAFDGEPKICHLDIADGVAAYGGKPWRTNFYILCTKKQQR